MLTRRELRKVLHYNPATGVFTWRVAGGRNGTEHQPGDRADVPDHREYRRVPGYGYAHRLAWLYVHGWLPARLDHKRGWRNNIDNLRPCNQSQNGGNHRRNKNNTSGFKGVSLLKRTGRFQAYIMKDRKRQHLGYFDTAEEAHAVYMEAAKRCFGEFARAG